jgi:hypothetical protein
MIAWRPLVVALVVGCASTPAARDDGAVHTPPTAPAAPTPSPSPPTAAAEAQPTPPAPPVVPARQYPDAMDVLADLCAVASHDGKTGCSCCPPFDDCRPKKGAQPEAAEPAYRPDVVLKGSFSAPGREEAILGSDFQCQDNLSAYGHVVIARRQGGKGWKLVDHLVTSLQYASSYRLADGRDLAVVVSLVGKLPSYTLATWDLSKPEGEQAFHQEALMEWTTDAYAGCTGVEPGATLVDLRVLSLDQLERDGDGKLDLVLELLERSGKPNAAYQKACNEMMEEVPGADPAAALTTRRFARIFRFDGKGFQEISLTPKGGG